MSFQRGTECPPTVEVERHAAGEETKFRPHIDACAGCTAYVRELKEAAAAFNAQRPADLFMRQVDRRREAQGARRPFLSWILAGVGTVALASIALVVMQKPPDDVRFKGGTVEIYVKRGLDEPVRLLDGATVKPGDTLRFRYRGAERAHLAVIEQDGAGAVTVFVPFGQEKSAELAPDEFAPGAVAIDETPGASTLYVVQRGKSFDLTPLVETIRSFNAPSCDGCSVETIRYGKTP